MCLRRVRTGLAPLCCVSCAVLHGLLCGSACVCNGPACVCRRRVCRKRCAVLLWVLPCRRRLSGWMQRRGHDWSTVSSVLRKLGLLS